MNKKTKDDRPDWLKAAAYEMMYLRNELNKALKSVEKTKVKIKYALKQADELGKNIDENTLSTRYKKHLKKLILEE